MVVGRQEESRALLAAFEHAAEGQPAALLVGGEAGVGKSRLVREASSGMAGARVLTGTCRELAGRPLPFAAFVDVLRGLVRGASTPSRAPASLTAFHGAAAELDLESVLGDSRPLLEP